MTLADSEKDLGAVKAELRLEPDRFCRYSNSDRVRFAV